jgi:rhamnose transport system ATP-binding protein
VEHRDPELAVAIACRDISKRFSGTQALHPVSLDVAAGEIHALVGENGAGKSTLLGILSGRIAATAGEVRVFGEPLQAGDPRAARQAGIATIYQELTMIPALSALANVFLGQELSRGGALSEREMHVRYRGLCEEFGVSVPPDRPARTLTVAQQQALEIMRGLNARSRILLFDEPTAALSERERDALFRLVNHLKVQGITIVFVSHNLDEVLQISDTVTVLREGRLVASRAKGEWTKRDLVRAMLGKEVEFQTQRAAAPGERVVLKAEGVTLPGAIEDISLEVRSGEIVGLGGLVGSGRTSLLRCLAGLEPRSHGRLCIGGREVKWPRSPHQAIRLGIALVPEDRKAQGLVLGMPAADNVTMTWFKAVSRFSFLFSQRQRDAAGRLTSQFGFDPRRLVTRVRNLSGGNQQKVLLAKSIHRRPSILLADEPTRGIDIGAKAEVMHSLEKLSESGLGVIIASSELEEVLKISDRILVLSEGRLVDTIDAREHIVTVGDILHAAFKVGDESEFGNTVTA